MKFDKLPLSEEILENLSRQQFHRTTDIQFKAFTPILNGEDVLAIAQTGTGKTLAFALPIVQKIHSFKSSKRSYGIKCLVLVPTRELAKQIGEVVAKICKGTKASSYAVYGGIEMDPQIQQLKGGIDILIATPGRMFDLIKKSVIDISEVSFLVLDEADRMLDLGFIDDIKAVKRRLEHAHQTLFFSATINPKIKKLAYSQISSKAMRIQISPEKMVSKNISHYVIPVEMNDKRTVLLQFIKSNPNAKAMVFFRTKLRTERVSDFLRKNNVNIFTLHGDMNQMDREDQLSKFTKQTHSFLLATDISARGIDVSGISHVINFDLPDDPENYVHRIGRTGRGFAKGEAISFFSPEEKDKLKAIESFLNTKLDVVEVDSDEFKVDQNINLDSEIDFSKFIEQEENRIAAASRPRIANKIKKKS